MADRASKPQERPGTAMADRASKPQEFLWFGGAVGQFGVAGPEQERMAPDGAIGAGTLGI